MYCGKTADQILMPFEVVSGVGRLMGVLEGEVSRVNFSRPIVTNGTGTRHFQIPLGGLVFKNFRFEHWE